MPTLTTKDGVDLFYEIHDYTDPWKNAPFLILQHGYGRSGKFFRAMIPYLSRWYRIVTPDLRGLGQSSSDFDLGRGLTIENYVSDLVAIADHLGAETFHYGAESFGGIIGYALAAKHPARIRTLSVMSSPVTISKWTQEAFAFGHPSWQDALRTMGSQNWSLAANGATRFPPGTSEGLLQWYADEMGKSKVEVMVAMSEYLSACDSTEFLAKIRCPVLGLYSAAGAVTTDDQLNILRQNIPDLTIVRFEGWGHAVQALEPAGCAKAILAFAATHDGVICHE